MSAEHPAATVEQRLAIRLACPHKHTYVKRTPPTWATDPYPAVITEECEDCGKLVAVTNVERPKSWSAEHPAAQGQEYAVIHANGNEVARYDTRAEAEEAVAWLKSIRTPDAGKLTVRRV